jgi:hypothetical protein
MEAERKSHFKSGTSGFETSAGDANGQTVARVYARQNEAEAAPALSDLGHKQVRSKKAMSAQRKGIVPRLTKGNGHDRFSYRQGRSNDFR